MTKNYEQITCVIHCQKILESFDIIYLTQPFVNAELFHKTLKEQHSISSSPLSTGNVRSRKWKRNEDEDDEEEEEKEDKEDQEESEELFSDQTGKGKEKDKKIPNKPSNEGRGTDFSEESDFNVSQTEQAKKKRRKSSNVSTGATPAEKRKKRLTDKKFEQGKMSKDSRIY